MQVVCYRDGDKTGGLELEKRREDEDSLASFILKFLNDKKP